MNLDYFQITYIVIFILNVFLGFIVLKQNSKAASNRIFALMLASLSAWIVSLYFLPIIKDYDLLIFVGRLGFLFPITFIYLFFLFSTVFPENNFAEYKVFKIIATILFIGAALASFTPGVIDSLVITSYMPKSNFGALYGPYNIAVYAMIIMAFYIVSRRLAKSQGVERSQIKIFFLGFLLSIVATLITNTILPNITGVRETSRLAPFNMIFLLAGVFYAIVRYKLFDVRVFVGRFTYYFLLSIIVLITYRIVLLSNNAIWGSALDIRGMITGSVFAFIFVVFYDQFKKFIQSRISSVLINPGFEPNEIIVSFNKTISTLLDYEEIASLLDETIEKTIRPNLLSVFVKLEDRNKFILKTKSEKDTVTLNYDNIYKLWENSAYIPIFLNQIEVEVPRKFSPSFHELSLVVEEMRQKGIKLILPIGVKENSNGVLVLGSKEADSSYNSVQIKYLESLCEITALALMRAKLYEEVQEFNETLQQKVKDATIEIQSQNSKLSEALRVERDMLDVLGHELRTPLGTIRNAMGVVDLKYKSKQFTNADLEGFLKIGTENIRREIQLLETILASAKIDNDKLDMNFEKVDSNDVLGDSFEAYKYDAEKKGIKLIQTLPPEIVYSYADRLRIQQVMDNLVSNSIKYTQTGQIELKLQDEGKYVRFSVSDTGEGIPEEDIPKLGTKFFRANMYLKSEGKIGDRKIVRPGGTGIGLYVVYQIVKYMYGEVKVTSKVGAGSTFSFTVLKYTQELENRSSFILAGKDSVRTYNNDDLREPVN